MALRKSEKIAYHTKLAAIAQKKESYSGDGAWHQEHTSSFFKVTFYRPLTNQENTCCNYCSLLIFDLGIDVPSTLDISGQLKSWSWADLLHFCWVHIYCNMSLVLNGSIAAHGHKAPLLKDWSTYDSFQGIEDPRPAHRLEIWLYSIIYMMSHCVWSVSHSNLFKCTCESLKTTTTMSKTTSVSSLRHFSVSGHAEAAANHSHSRLRLSGHPVCDGMSSTMANRWSNPPNLRRCQWIHSRTPRQTIKHLVFPSKNHVNPCLKSIH